MTAVFSNKPARIALFASILIGFGLLYLSISLSSQEPVYEGKSLTVWLDELNWGMAEHPAHDQKVIEWMRQVGKPFFKKILLVRDSYARRLLLKLKGRYPALKLKIRSAAEYHRLAVKGFQVLGLDSYPSASDFVQILLRGDEEAQHLAAAWLGRIGRPAVDPLAKLLKDSDPEIRKRALNTLSLIGREATGIAPILTEMLRDDDLTIRKEATRVLFMMRTKEAVPGLAIALRDRDASVRHMAAQSFRLMVTVDPGAIKEVLPILEKARTDPDSGVRGEIQATIEWAQRSRY